MAGTTEAFSRVRIDALLADAGWNLSDGVSVLFEHALPDGSRADYVLCNRAGTADGGRRGQASEHPAARRAGPGHPLRNAARRPLRLPLERRGGALPGTRPGRPTPGRSRPSTRRRIWNAGSPRDRCGARWPRFRSTGRSWTAATRFDCIEALSAQVAHGRHKLLVEMATGTGKTRTAGRLRQAPVRGPGAVTPRPLPGGPDCAGHTGPEDAFTDHLRDYPCHVLRPGRGFDRAKRITIATLQTMIAEYRTLSSGYFDLVITDECHRSSATASGAACCAISTASSWA